MRSRILLLSFFLLLQVAATAQTTGTIVGTVTDGSGAVVDLANLRPDGTLGEPAEETAEETPEENGDRTDESGEPAEA